MADGEPMVPDENARLDWRRYCLQVTFHPQVKLRRRQDCLSFGKRISEYVELGQVEIGTNEWSFSGGAECEGLGVRVVRDAITLDAVSPPHNLEFYEPKFEHIIHLVRDMFAPVVVLRRKAIVTSLIDLPKGGNAKAFLGGHIMLMHPQKLAPINRPLHVLGVRLYFPPFEVEEPKSEVEEPKRKTDWGVNLRIESCINPNDSHRLFVEATAVWDEPVQCNQEIEKNSVECLSTTIEFMKNEVIQFLRQPPMPNDENEEEANGN